MMPRIAVVAPAAYPLGGLATWLDYLAPGLQREGFGVETLLTSGRWHDVEAYARAHPNLAITSVESASGTREGRIRALTRALKSRPVDLVLVVNVPDTYAAVARLRASPMRGPRCAMTIHAIEPEYFEDLRANGDIVDCVIATNRLTCELASGWSAYSSDRILYAPYGVELPERLRNHEDHECIEILFAGRLEENQKRVSQLPPLVARLEQLGVHFRVTVAGDGPDGLALGRGLAEAGERGVVRWLGRIERERLVHEVLPEHDLFLLTSEWETGPIAIWEAMAAGLAVVSSRYLGSGLEGALVDYQNCRLFDVGDVEGAARAIADLVPATVRAAIGRSGREMIERRYSRQSSVAAWAEACRRAIRVTPSRPRVRRDPLPAGRLDRTLGVRLAESLRRLIGLSFQHAGPGGEWPHSYGRRERLREFLERACELERRPA